jgi:D-glycerate 3-kinase
MSTSMKGLIEAERLPQDYETVVDRFWRPLSEDIAERALDRSGPGPLIVGINGAQGSGKSTLAKMLEVLLVEHNQRAVTLALDDLYLTRAERQQAAADHHPLFATRGVPGTHDVALGSELLEGLRDGRHVTLPRFDKARDDRAPDGVLVTAPVDVVLFEGWCVGAVPQPAAALRTPINALEAGEDADGTWRREVNRRLATDYAELFGRIDWLLMLKVGGWDEVRANRRRQEAKLGTGPAVMDDAALDRFLMHYERLTRWQFAEMPDRADRVIAIGPDQRPL